MRFKTPQDEAEQADPDELEMQVGEASEDEGEDLMEVGCVVIGHVCCRYPIPSYTLFHILG